MTPTPHGHGHGHGHGRRGSTGALPQLPGHGHDTDSEALPPQHGSVLMGIIKQLAANSDLSRVALPAFILEPRSMLERVSDFFVHPELLLAAIDSSNELDRFVAVVRWFLAGWHVRPKGVRKPFNPVLGELFRAHWQLDSASQGQVRAYYLAEQTSHHPPKSEFLYAIPKLSVRARGELLPKSRFLGNSAASLMHGHTLLTLPSASYIITMPNVYARGILFGEMHQELGDTATVKSVEHGLEAEIEFLGRGWFRDNTNGVKGRIKKDGKVLYNLEGRWDSIVTIKGTEKVIWSTVCVGSTRN